MLGGTVAVRRICRISIESGISLKPCAGASDAWADAFGESGVEGMLGTPVIAATSALFAPITHCRKRIKRHTKNTTFLCRRWCFAYDRQVWSDQHQKEQQGDRACDIFPESDQGRGVGSRIFSVQSGGDPSVSQREDQRENRKENRRYDSKE